MFYEKVLRQSHEFHKVCQKIDLNHHRSRFSTDNIDAFKKQTGKLGFFPNNDLLDVENGFDKEVIDKLKSKGHRINHPV